MFRRIRLNLLSKMILLMSFVVISCLILSIFLFSYIFTDAMNQHFGKRAMDVALLVSKNEQIIAAFEIDHPPLVIQPVAENIRQLTGASYVVVGNLDNVRYSHHNPHQIGLEMGTSNEEVFEGNKSIIYDGIGVSGAATKAKTPIYNKSGEIIGVSSVGFLYEDINNEMEHYKALTYQLFFVVLIVGIIGAYIVARKLKRMFFGLEPEEIAYLFKEKEAILESMHDATVATNHKGNIVTMNKKARKLPYFRNLEVGEKLLHPQIVKELNSIHSKSDVSNKEVILDGERFVMDYSIIHSKGPLTGIVFTFRSVSEIERLTEEFSKIKIVTENMRAQNHEYLNKLNTIYGLLKLNNVDGAVKLISKEVSSRQDFITFLIESVKNPMIAACLLGKANRASELKVELIVEENSELQPLSNFIDEQKVVTILANVLENAIEAALHSKQNKGKVVVSFTDLGPDIIFDIEDNGVGISAEQEKRIFEDGYTTKNSPINHGIGLSLVKHSLETLSGELFISKSELGGARFTITIPKEVSLNDKVH